MMVFVYVVGNKKLNNEPKKILDVGGISKEDQRNSKALKQAVTQKEWRIKFEQADGKIRYAYTDDPDTVESYLKDTGAIILKVEKTNE